MQMQVEEANIRVIEELELASIIIEETPPVIKEAHVIVQDTTEIDSFTAKVSASSDLDYY